MKMKLEKLVKHESALVALDSVTLTDYQKAWDLSIALDGAKEHLKKFNESRDALVKKMGSPVDGSPEKFQIQEKDAPAFIDELNKLLAVAVVVSFPKIPIDVLKDAEVSAANVSAWRDLCILTNKK